MQGLPLLSSHKALNGKVVHIWSQVSMMKLLIAFRLNLMLVACNRICHASLISIYVGRI
jgi:hypothetical protein